MGPELLLAVNVGAGTSEFVNSAVCLSKAQPCLSLGW